MEKLPSALALIMNCPVLSKTRCEIEDVWSFGMQERIIVLWCNWREIYRRRMAGKWLSGYYES